MRMGIITRRRKQRRAAKLWKSMGALSAGMIAILAFLPLIMTKIGNTPVFSEYTQRVITLPEYDVYALQLAVFDNGERAASELKRLQNQGVRCVVWQKERMRIVADAAFDREELNMAAANGHEAYVIREKLEAVSLRLSADAVSVEQAGRLLEAPDALLDGIVQGSDSLQAIADQAKALADEALGIGTENTLYVQLAQNLRDWSLLMRKTLETADESEARSYGAVTMCTLCRELRQALSALSTASAQRTPSTAAEVMPPA